MLSLEEIQQHKLKAYRDHFAKICNDITWLEHLHKECVDINIPQEELVLQSPCGKIVDFTK